MADEAVKTDDVQAVNVQGSNAANITMTMDEAAQAKPAEGPTPESLNVSQEQFDKYYSADKGYNWEAHARELAFQNDQRAAKGEQTTEAKPEADPEPTKGGEIDWNGLGAKIGDGTFGDSDKQALMNLGIPGEIVDEYVQVLKQNVDMHFQTVAAAFGGEQRMEQIFRAAQAQMNDAELAQVEQLLADPAKYRMAVDMVTSRVGAGGPIGGPNANTGSPSEAAKPYESQQEMLADQRNPKYKTDPAFRNEVYRRAAASTFNVGNHTL